MLKYHIGSSSSATGARWLQFPLPGFFTISSRMYVFVITDESIFNPLFLRYPVRTIWALQPNYSNPLIVWDIFLHHC